MDTVKQLNELGVTVTAIVNPEDHVREIAVQDSNLMWHVLTESQAKIYSEFLVARSFELAEILQGKALPQHLRASAQDEFDNLIKHHPIDKFAKNSSWTWYTLDDRSVTLLSSPT